MPLEFAKPLPTDIAPFCYPTPYFRFLTRKPSFKDDDCTFTDKILQQQVFDEYSGTFSWESIPIVEDEEEYEKVIDN